jgi:flotillin
MLRSITKFVGLTKYNAHPDGLTTEGKMKIRQNTQKRTLYSEIILISGAAAISSFAMFASQRYRISDPDEYLIKTGLFIDDIDVSKNDFQWPFQTYTFIKMQPTNYTFHLQAMTSEKMEFVLPGVFTIGPKDEPDAIKKYVKFLMSRGEDNEYKIEKLVKGILEGETRILAAQMTMEQIFNDKKAFKEVLIFNVQSELDKFGAIIHNANVKELEDTPGSEYFSFLRQKKRSETENTAKVDVAEAKKIGDIGQKMREAETRQITAQYEAETVFQENIRQQEIEKSNAELAVVRAAAEQKTKLAEIEAENVSKKREAEMQGEVENKRISMETEKIRANKLSRAMVEAEIMIKEAEGNAEALKLESDAKLYSKQKEAEGIYAVYEAQSEGINKLVDSFGNDTSCLIQYLMLEKNVYEKLAKANAEAIRDMKPKISVWDMGGTNKYTDSISNILKMIPPLVDTVNQQTGIKPPNWMLNTENSLKE